MLTITSPASEFDKIRNEFIKEQVQIIDLLDKLSLPREKQIFIDFTDDLLKRVIVNNNIENNSEFQNVIRFAKSKLKFGVHDFIVRETKLGVNPVVKEHIGQAINSYISSTKIYANEKIPQTYEITKEEEFQAKEFDEVLYYRNSTQISHNPRLRTDTIERFTTVENNFASVTSSLMNTLAANSFSCNHDKKNDFSREISIILDTNSDFVTAVRSRANSYRDNDNIHQVNTIYNANISDLKAAAEKTDSIHNKIKEIIENNSLEANSQKEQVTNLVKNYEQDLKDKTKKIEKTIKFINDRKSRVAHQV